MGPEFLIGNSEGMLKNAAMFPESEEPYPSEL